VFIRFTFDLTATAHGGADAISSAKGQLMVNEAYPSRVNWLLTP
jgi:hypothetical protein